MCSSRCGSYQSSSTLVFPPDWLRCSVRAPVPYAEATNSELPGAHTGVLMANPLLVACSCDQSSAPLSGLKPNTVLAARTTTCGWPSTLTSSGEECEFVNCSAFQTTAPSLWRNAITPSPLPPAW